MATVLRAASGGLSILISRGQRFSARPHGQNSAHRVVLSSIARYQGDRVAWSTLGTRGEDEAPPCTRMFP